MILRNNDMRDTGPWKNAGYELPEYNRDQITINTRSDPQWIHFGAGNIFRAFPAAVQQRLLNKGKSKTGIIAVEGYDYEVIEKAYRPYDNLSLLVILKSDGTIEKKVIGSVVESLLADSVGHDWERLTDIFTKESLQMASFTITEKGYSLVKADGTYLADVMADLENGPSAPLSIMGKVTALCYIRYKNGREPLALVSMDNCSHNGTKLYTAIQLIAKKWCDAGLADPGFIEYVENPSSLSFPWSMIDKITPRPDESVQKMLQNTGFEDTEIIITCKNTWTAPFVNAEESEYLIIEDWFPNGRPPLEEGGVIFTTRETVDRVEKMKVCTCLNPLHTALAIFGCLLGYTSIHNEMHDTELKALIEKIGYKEGLPVVIDPGIIQPEDFIREVINTRFPNPFMPDTPQRIATDTSQKLAIRFGETIKAYRAHPTLSVNDLVYIPLVLAGWCRYLMAVDDKGVAFAPSSDPLLSVCQAYTDSISLGDTGPFHDTLAGLLSRADIFGVDLYEVGLGERVEGYFAEMTAGKGAVRSTLRKYL